MARDQPQMNFRIPAELKERLEDAATRSGRSLTAEMVQRLEGSFFESQGAAQLHAEVARVQALADRFKDLADAADSDRAMAAMLYLLLTDNPAQIKHDKKAGKIVAAWLSESSYGGAAWSLLELVDGATPERVEALRAFAAELEAAGMKRKQIQLSMFDRAGEDGAVAEKEEVQAIVRGKVQGTGVMVPKGSVPASPAVKRAQAKVAKKGVRK